MPTLFAANESSVMIGSDLLEGVRALDYRYQQTRSSVYALGSAQRISTVSGAQMVEGRIHVASTATPLDGKLGDEPFEIIATLKHGTVTMTVTFQECLLTEKTFDLSVGGHGESIYSFTATSIVEKIE